MPTPEELYERGVAACRGARHAQARVLLERARAELAGERSDGDLLAKVENTLAYVWAETGEPDAALDLCRRALSRPGIEDETRGLLHSQIALLLMLRGASEAALASFDAAIEWLREPSALAKAYLNRGNVYLQQSRTRRALDDFAACERYYREADDEYGAAKACHNRGYALFLSGDLVEALACLRRANPTLAAQGPVMKAVVEQDLAEVLTAAGLVHEGVATLREASATYGRRRLHLRRGEAEFALARNLLHLDPEASLAAARRARTMFVRSGADAWRVRAEAAALAAEVELGRRGPSLLSRGEELIAELDAQGLYWGATSVRLHTARVMVRRKLYDDARRRLGRVRVDDRAPLAVRLLARDVRAELAAALGRRTAALMHLRNGLDDLHEWQSSFGSLDLQTMVAGHGSRLAVRGLRLAAASGDPEIVFEWSERARMFASRVQPVRAPADDQIAADLSELRTLAEPADGPRVPVPRRDAELRQRVREKAWQHRGSGEVTDPCRLADVQAELGPGRALVATVVTADRVLALVVTDTAAHLHELGERDDLETMLGGLLPDLDVAASDLPDVFARPVREQLRHRLQELADLLVTPVLDQVGGRELVLTPSGLLSGTPWTLLPGLTGRPVTVAQSATSWLGRQGPLRLRTAGFVAGPRVPRAVDEVTEAAEGWVGAEVLVGDKASCAAVSSLAGSVDVLHVAAHGRHSSENPMFSGLELVDGSWYGYDIDQLAAVPQVVLLSACEMGRSSVRYGEELIGMATAWLHAGARCVVASAAAVNDDAAHRVLTEVHSGLAAGMPPAAALAAAVPPVTADAAPAPFVCFV